MIPTRRAVLGATLLAPFAARAQARPVPRIGVLTDLNSPSRDTEA